MNSFFKHLQNEDGFAIIVALFVLILLTIIGISATNTSTIDLRIASNDKSYQIAFYNADSGIFATPKLISKTVDKAELITGSDQGNISYLARPSGDTSNFFRQVMGYDSYDNGTLDIQFPLGVYSVDVDVNRTGQEILVGGGAEFASGAEGIGGGASMALYFEINSFGSGPANANSNVSAVYRKVVGVPGGL